MVASLVGNLSNFTSKNRLIRRESNRELILLHRGFLQHSQGASFTGKVQVCQSGSGYNEPLSEREVGSFPWLEST